MSGLSKPAGLVWSVSHIYVCGQVEKSVDIADVHVWGNNDVIFYGQVLLSPRAK